jgi:NAD(P)-dependent dehydrogenase (short-subunit alcohol dehydrogenase family)
VTTSTTPIRAAELFDLSGKVAVVTGGPGGIGRVYCWALAEAGAAVAVADLNEDAAVAAASALEAEGYEAFGVALDVVDPDSAAAAAAAVVDRFGGIDILVNNAALMSEIPRSSLLDLPLDWFERVIRVNVMGAVVCSKAVVGSMLARGGGRIVNGSSAGGFTPGGIYAISKLALHSVTANLAFELGSRGITVNAIAPGLVANESGFRSLAADDPIRDAIKSAIPGKKEGPPEDLVGTLLLLCSKAGEWINGQTISVDGGWIMRL